MREITRELKNRQRRISRPGADTAVVNGDGMREALFKALTGVTADATPVNLAGFDGDAFLALEDNQTCLVVAEVLVVRTGGVAVGGAVGYSKTFVIHALLQRNVGAVNTVEIDTQVEISSLESDPLGETDTWAAALVPDTTNGGIAVEATGEADKDLKWSANLSVVLVQHG